MDSDVNVLMVVPNYEFRDEEYSVPATIFRDNGIGVKIVAEENNDCVGIGGTEVTPDYTFDEVNTDQFDAIVYIGGAGVERYFANDLAKQLAKDFLAANKLVCAICWATVVLAKAGILEGRKVTGSENGKKSLEQAGAIYISEALVIDEKIITAIGPEAANEFGRTISDILLK